VVYEKNEYGNPNETQFGQHNFFFRFELKNDTRVTGIPMSSCSIRKTDHLFTVEDVPLTGIYFII
jgi:hypothetical protein